LTWESQGDRNVTDTISYQLQELHRARTLNHKAMFLIVICSGTSLPPQVTAFRILQDMWASYNIKDVLLLIPYVHATESYMNTLHDDKEINDKEFGLYTWHPHSSEGNCANVNLNLIDKWLVKDKGEFIYNANLFPDKFSGDFMGCTVKVATGILPSIVDELPDGINKKYCGWELNFLANILERLNLSAEFKVLFPNNKSSVEFRTDFIRETAYGEADISIGGLVMSEEVESLVDFTVSYKEIALKWYVPCAKYVDRCEAVLKMFSLGTWISIHSVNFLVAVIMRFIATHVYNHQFRESYNYTTFNSCLYTVCAIILGVSVSQLPRTPPLRMFFSIVLCYSIALSTILQTYFASFLVSPRLEIQINSVKDIFDLGIGYGYSSDIGYFLEGTDEFEYQIIKEHRVKCGNQYQCLNRVMKYGNFACITNTFSVARLMNSKVSKDMKSKVLTVSTDILKLRSVMYFKIGHPLLYSLNKIIRRVIEGGLQIKWDNDLYLTNIHKPVLSFCYENDTLDYNSASDDNILESGYYVISVTHLQIAFYSFLIGCVLSSVVLVAEILYHM
jgi:hypothetical protein